ncbi:MAG: non-homologous end-joining DNA ligase [bacterium]
MSVIKLNNHKIELRNEEKIFFPKNKITKGDLIKYYKEISPVMLPYLKDRAISMQRFPSGIKGISFYEKDAPGYFPKWIKTVNVKRKTNGSYNCVVCQNAATLVYIANQGCITPHIWLSTIKKLNYPDKIIFDLDLEKATPTNFKLACQTAKALKEIIESIGLSAYVMTTGSKGLHVCIPIKIEYTFDKIRAFAKQIALKAIEKNPDKLTLESRKEKRKNKLLIDIMRNGFGATSVTPYAIRPIEGAPVATPLEWKELDKKNLSSQTYTIKNIFNRLSKTGDAWKLLPKNRKSLNLALKKIQG